MPSAAPSYASVVFNRPLREALAYTIPPGLAERVGVGVLVRAPLGTKVEVGCVVGTSGDPPDGVDAGSIKALEAVASEGFRIPDEVLDLARFVSSYYFSSLGEALSSASLVGFNDVRGEVRQLWSLRMDWRALVDAAERPLTATQQAACERIESLSAASRAEMAKAAEVSSAVIAKLGEAGLLEERAATSTLDEHLRDPEAPLAPTEPQHAAIDSIERAALEGRFEAFLLHGVTGSGKTEVYLQAMARVLARGRSVLCLVPEISLTPQTLSRFEKRFSGPVGVSHSQMTRRQKLELADRIAKGEVRIVIGARSAVFAPLPDLGLVVVDEEHDGSYKQGESPRYNARDLAVVRAQRLSIPVVLGSATPSLDSYANARAGKYTLLRLPDRPPGTAMPVVEVIDMGQEALRDSSLPTQLSPRLVDAMRKRLAVGEQTILFLNRRGFSSFLFCPSCKWVARCGEDDVALTVHRRRMPLASAKEPELDLFEEAKHDESEEGFLKCHFCGQVSDLPSKCPACGAPELVRVGTGTQRVEDEVRSLFPDVTLLRLDQDAVSTRGKFESAWARMVSGEARIILGTQMIAKGLHLERVTLVGVVLADIGMYLPDFRAEERTFSLLMQVAGRAGRGAPGEVLVQTYLPTHPVVRLATAHDYEGYFEHEDARRRRLGFPPHSKLGAVTISAADGDLAFKHARVLAGLLWRHLRATGGRNLRVAGPTAAPLAKLAGRMRARILLVGKGHSEVARALRACLSSPDWRPPSSVRVGIDIDPMDLM